jgi:hypothetical protein
MNRQNVMLFMAFLSVLVIAVVLAQAQRSLSREDRAIDAAAVRDAFARSARRTPSVKSNIPLSSPHLSACGGTFRALFARNMTMARWSRN